MIKVLRVLFVVILASMLWVTTWAGMQCPLFAVPRSVATHPWFIATMFDAYWGFVTFYVWVFYRQVSWTDRMPPDRGGIRRPRWAGPERGTAGSLSRSGQGN